MSKTVQPIVRVGHFQHAAVSEVRANAHFSKHLRDGSSVFAVRSSLRMRRYIRQVREADPGAKADFEDKLARQLPKQKLNPALIQAGQ